MPSWAINSTKLSNYKNFNKMEETSKNNETAQLGIGTVTCRKIMELNTKNESKTEYSLGDVMLLDKWEKQLESLNYTRTEIEAMSPSFYGR